MHLPRGLVVVIVIACVGAAPSFLASCGGEECSTTTNGAGYDASFVGRLTGRSDGTATFSVESAKTVRNPSPNDPIPKLTASVVVEYPDGNTQFLHVGKRYFVNVEWSGSAFRSDVHRAGSCSPGGTRNADGSQIDTANLPWLHQAVLVAAALPVVALFVVTLVVWSTRRRRRSVVVVER